MEPNNSDSRYVESLKLLSQNTENVLDIKDKDVLYALAELGIDKDLDALVKSED